MEWVERVPGEKLRFWDSLFNLAVPYCTMGGRRPLKVSICFTSHRSKTEWDFLMDNVIFAIWKDPSEWLEYLELLSLWTLLQEHVLRGWLHETNIVQFKCSILYELRQIMLLIILDTWKQSLIMYPTGLLGTGIENVHGHGANGVST